MPELPEVQVVINYLNSNIINKKIIDIEIRLQKLFKNIRPIDFKKKVTNHSFKNIIRKGKYLIFILDNGAIVLSHLRMEGKYNYDKNDKIEKHDHIIYKFADNTTLKYNDSRQFGTIHYFNNINDALNSKELKKIGIDPFDENFNSKSLLSQFKKSNKKLKTFLLDQSHIAGIGNIYANEICFATGLSPESLCCNLSSKDIENIIIETKKILKESIKYNGTTIHSFTFSKWDIGNYQDKLLVHGRKKCPRCENDIIKLKINGRGTYFCKKCQKIKK